MKITSVKYFSVLLVVLFSCGTYSNSEEAQDKNDAFCNCFETTKEPNIDLRLSLCISDTLDANDAQNFLIDNIRKCDAVFSSLVDLQDSMILLSAIDQIDNHNSRDKDYITGDELYTQAINKYLIAQNYDSIIIYTDKFPQDHNIENLFIRAYAFEKLGKYDDAISIYEELIKMTSSSRYEVSISIAERKRKASNIN